MADVSSSDLLWDHAGEDLEDNPLINTYSTDTPARQRGNRRAVHDIDRGGVQLSYYQTVKLLENLEESSETLKQYLEDLNGTSQENDRDTTTINSSMRQRFCQKCLRALQQITGTKTIIFTLLLQGINLLIQTIIDIWSKKDDHDDNAILVSCVTMIVLQLVNLILIMFSSVKLARQLVGRKVNGILLVQSYFASILLFAGLYTVTSRLKPGSWKDIRESVEESPGLIIALYTKFLYFSVSTATLCGTASTSPFEWYNYIFVSLQMLLSFMYFASILGHALTPFAGESPKQKRLRAISAARREPDAITPCIRATPLPANYGTINDG